jgi:hypothetical protein
MMWLMMSEEENDGQSAIRQSTSVMERKGIVLVTTGHWRRQAEVITLSYRDD